MLDVRNLSVMIGNDVLVPPIDFSVEAGQPLIIMGETGAGKSLIAQSIMGSLPSALSAKGEITLHGQRIDRLPSKERQKLWGKGLAMLPQEPWRALDPLMPVVDQVSETHHYVGKLTKQEAQKTALADFHNLDLKGAEQKRVSR